MTTNLNMSQAPEIIIPAHDFALTQRLDAALALGHQHGRFVVVLYGLWLGRQGSASLQFGTGCGTAFAGTGRREIAVR